MICGCRVRQMTEWPVLAMMFDLGKVGTSTVERHILLAYDDRFSIEYFHRKLQPYWRRDGAEASDLLYGLRKRNTGSLVPLPGI